MTFIKISLRDFITTISPKTKLTIYDVERMAKDELGCGGLFLRVIIGDLGYEISSQSIKEYFEPGPGTTLTPEYIDPTSPAIPSGSGAIDPDKEFDEFMKMEDGN
jgi:hypothetical protein